MTALDSFLRKESRDGKEPEKNATRKSSSERTGAMSPGSALRTGELLNQVLKYMDRCGGIAGLHHEEPRVREPSDGRAREEQLL